MQINTSQRNGLTREEIENELASAALHNGNAVSLLFMASEPWLVPEASRNALLDKCGLRSLARLSCST